MDYYMFFFLISIIVVLVDKFFVHSVHHALVRCRNLELRNPCAFVKLVLKNLTSTKFNSTLFMEYIL